MTLARKWMPFKKPWATVPFHRPMSLSDLLNLTKIYISFIKSVSFSDPIWVLFSSGTTGKPEAIVHCTGAMIFKHQKRTIHQNVCERSIFWYSTTSWMMWNYALSEFVVWCYAVCIMAHQQPKPSVLWDFTRKKINHFGHETCIFSSKQMRVSGSEGYDFHHLKTIGSTGSPLSADTCKSLQHRFPNTHIISLSGGNRCLYCFYWGTP